MLCSTSSPWASGVGPATYVLNCTQTRRPAVVKVPLLRTAVAAGGDAANAPAVMFSAPRPRSVQSALLRTTSAGRAPVNPNALIVSQPSQPPSGCWP